MTPILIGSERQVALAIDQRARLAALLDEMPGLANALEEEARATGGGDDTTKLAAGLHRLLRRMRAVVAHADRAGDIIDVCYEYQVGPGTDKADLLEAMLARIEMVHEQKLGTIYARSLACWQWLADGTLDGVTRHPMRAE